MTTIIIDNTALQQKLEHAAQQLTDTTPLMQRISVALMNVTEENFAAEGRPAWAGLKVPRDGGKILQKSGQLAASILPFYGNGFAGIGSNKVYAPIHQFGGMAGRGRKVEIPARPYLPMNKDGNLQQEAFDDVTDTIDAYMKIIF